MLNPHFNLPSANSTNYWSNKISEAISVSEFGVWTIYRIKIPLFSY